jgi:hypothetical protein
MLSRKRARQNSQRWVSQLGQRWHSGTECQSGDGQAPSPRARVLEPSYFPFKGALQITEINETERKVRDHLRAKLGERATITMVKQRGDRIEVEFRQTSSLGLQMRWMRLELKQLRSLNVR